MGDNPRVEQVLKFKDKGVSVEEARAAMLAAGEAPNGLLKEVRKNVAVVPRGEGGSSSAPAPAPAPAPKRKYPTSARLTVINADGTDGESRVISAGTPQQLDAQIKATHARAVAAKKNVRVELISEDEPVSPAGETPVIVETSAPAQPTPQASTAVAEVERSENAKFILEIKQENGEWVGEITYKNGAGSERFTAPSRNALNMKLLEGKAHGTLRVREAIRREKYGVELDQVYTLPDYMTQEAFNALPEEARQGMVDTIAANEGVLFKDAHPEYYPTAGNSERIQKFLNRQPNENGGRGLPYTFKNIEFAFAELSEQDPEWEFRPVPKSVAPSVSAPAALAEDSAAPSASVAPVSTVAAPAAPAVAVRKRGSTGLQPGFSSAAPAELETTEEGDKSREPSVAELRTLPMSELKKRYKETLKPNRQF